MEPTSRSERAALCNTALEVGEFAPTLCGDWTAKELVIHLLVRERDPIASVGVVMPVLSNLTERATRRLEAQDFASLVERVRTGPPRWSPFSVPPVDRAANTLEFFVHHEDIRRAQPDWTARELPPGDQTALWRSLRIAGKALLRRAGIPVQLRWDDGSSEHTTTLRSGDRPVLLTGTPDELALFCFGRREVAQVDLTGPEQAVARLRSAPLGF